MTKMTLSDFENTIQKAKDLFFEEFKIMLKLVSDSSATALQIRNELTTLHKKGVDYFNLFERSISEYGLAFYKQDQNIRNSKIDDAINLAETIIKYWNLLSDLKDKYQIRIPHPSERAYSSLQLFLKTFEPDKAKELETKFNNANLPIHGFITSKKFFDMTKKQQISYGIIVGTLLLVALLIISLVVDCPTDSQNRVFTTLLALSAAAFSAVIPGFINVKYREIITASGALAVFVIVYLLKPTDLSDYANCQKLLSGTVYFGEKPQSNVELILIKQNQQTNTDNFGNFKLTLDYSTIDESLKIQLKNKSIQLDTIISIDKSKIGESLDIHTNRYCANCSQLNSNGKKVNVIHKCSANQKYINDFIDGYSQAGKEQGFTVECVKE